MTQNRSRAYPAIDLRETTEILSKLLTALDWGEHSRDTIAEVLGYHSGSSGVAARKIAALGHFGFLQYRKGFYAPTELASRFRKSPSENEISLREAFLNPALFREIVFKYELLGRLPGQLAEILLEHGITENAKDEAAKILIRSGEHAGILNEDGTLCDAYYSTFGRCKPLSFPTRPVTPPRDADNPENETAPIEQQVFRLALTGNKEAEIRLPFQLNDLDLEVLKAQIGVLELQVKANKPVQPTNIRSARLSS